MRIPSSFLVTFLPTVLQVGGGWCHCPVFTLQRGLSVPPCIRSNLCLEASTILCYDSGFELMTWKDTGSGGRHQVSWCPAGLLCLCRSASEMGFLQNRQPREVESASLAQRPPWHACLMHCRKLLDIIQCTEQAEKAGCDPWAEQEKRNGA